jgi:hypothetical protein
MNINFNRDTYSVKCLSFLIELEHNECILRVMHDNASLTPSGPLELRAHKLAKIKAAG